MNGTPTPPTTPCRNASYERSSTPNAYLKALAKQLHVSAKDLLVLAPQNDPFNSGTPTDRVAAEWFAELMPPSGATHLRREHYRLLSKDGATLWDGTPYRNTDRCWSKLTNAAKHARYLGLVNGDRIRDQRNPPPIVFAETSEHEAPNADVLIAEWTLPTIGRHALGDVFLRQPTIDLQGYTYTPAYQPRHVEVWAEKSTMNDVLVPVCQRHGVNLTTAAGYQSITGSKNLLNRTREHGKDTVVLYISDFDPAGWHMPRAVARQLEYHANEMGLEHRVLLQPIALVPEQVARYNLPRVPIKESDRRRGNFEDMHGEGAVELDALEALHPGVLAGIVEAAILEHRDPSLPERFNDAHAHAQAELRAARDAVLERYATDVHDLRHAITETASAYEAELERLADGLDEALAPHRERAAALQQAITRDLASTVEALDLPPEPTPDAPTLDANAYMLDTARTYLEQLRAYQGGAE